MTRVLDLGSGDVRIQDIRGVCLTLGADDNMYAVLEVRGGVDQMIYSDPDPDLVMRVICDLDDALDHAPGRIILADLVRAAKRGVLAE